MPKSLKEIKGFQSGTLLNASERDIPDTAASFSLNVNPDSQEGILSAIESDKLRYVSLSVNNAFPIRGLLHGVSSLGTSSSNLGVTTPISDMSIFNGSLSIDVSFQGIHGNTENIILNKPVPSLQRAWNGISSVEFRPQSDISDSDTEISLTSDTQTLIFQSVADDSTTTISDCAITQSFVDGIAKLTVTGNTASNFDGKYIKIITPLNEEVKYQFDNDAGGPATGAESGAYTFIQLNGSGSSDNNAVATQIKTALENATYGHGYRLNCEITSDGSDRIVTITFTEGSALNHFNEYFVLTTDADGAFDGRITNEIIQIISVNPTKLTVKRSCFGTQKSVYSKNTSYKLWTNQYKFNNAMYPDSSGFCQIRNWSLKDGNSLGGNVMQLFSSQVASTASYKRRVGIHSSSGVEFKSSTRTLSGLTIDGTDLIRSGKRTTIFCNGSNNNGRRYEFLKGSTSISLKGDEVITDESSLSNEIFLEQGLIQNPTFYHNYAVDSADIEHNDIGANKTYKANKWGHTHYNWATGDVAYHHNSYVDATTKTKVVRVASGGVYNESTNRQGQSSNANLYPMQGADSTYMSIESEFADTYVNVQVTALIDASKISANSAVDNFAKNDILKINSEYMKITDVRASEISVERGLYGSSKAEHAAGSNIFRNVNHSIFQNIPSKDVYPSTAYSLKFFAKDLYAGSVVGNLRFSVELNGSYFNKDGEWVVLKEDDSRGYSSQNLSYMKEERWHELDDSFDSPFVSSETSKLDSTWREFSYIFNIPRDVDINTDLKISFSSSGKDGTKIGIDLPTLIEHEPILINDGLNIINSVGKLRNKDDLDLAIFNQEEGNFTILHKFEDKGNKLHTEFKEILYSPFASRSVISSDNNLSYAARNRNLHVGFGSKDEDSNPQWIGYLNHRVFGKYLGDNVYQDSDEIKSFGGTGLYALSKLTIAGEYEYQSVTFNGSDELTVTMTNNKSHNQAIGNNIIMREWGDFDNSWSGKGIWVVISVANSYTFVAKRPTSEVPATLPRNSKVCFRPYFFYGIKKGEPFIYRVWPDSRIKSGVGGDGSFGDIDTIKVKGTIEKSLPISFGIQSLCTSYNKSADGEGGGNLYVLSSTNADGEVSIINMDVGTTYSSYKEIILAVNNNFTVECRGIKWSNDNRNGNIGGSTPVFDDLDSSNSAPIISKTGIFSDIVETKGTSPTYDRKDSTGIGNQPNDFDCRLWLLSTPENYGSIPLGSRFLFCALADDNNLASGNVRFADRTPPLSYSNTDTFNSAHVSVYQDGGDDGSPYYTIGTANIGPMPTKNIEFYNQNISFKHIHYPNTSSGTITEFEGNKAQSPMVNFNDNSGFTSNSAVVKIPEYGLIQMGDNDGDGIIDGTGLVTANTDSCKYQINNQWVGPYGRHHEKVCSHAVGVLADCEGNSWLRIGGSVYGRESGAGVGAHVDDNGFSTAVYYTDSKYRLYYPSIQASFEKVLMISSDTHYGDRLCLQSLSSTSTVTAANGQTWTKGSASQKYFSPGDLCGRTFITKLNADGTVEIPVASINATYDRLGTFYPFKSGWTRTWGDDSGDYTEYNTTGPFYTTPDEHVNTAYNESDPTEDYTLDNVMKSQLYRTYYTQLNAGRIYEEEFGNTNDMNPLLGFMLTPGYHFKGDLLNYRAGVMIRPLVDSSNQYTPESYAGDNSWSELNISNSTVIDAPSTPDSVYHKDNPGFATLAYSTEVQSATHASFTLTIDDNAGSPAAPYASTAATEAVFLNQMVYKSDGSEFGICTSVTNNTTLVFGNGIKNAMADNDRLYTGYNNYYTHTQTSHNSLASKIFISNTYDPGQEQSLESRVWIADQSLIVPNSKSNVDVVTNFEDAVQPHHDSILSGTLDSSPYVKTAGSSHDIYRAADTNPVVKIKSADVEGDNATLIGTSSNWQNETLILNGTTHPTKKFRERNMLAQLMITIVDKDTGFPHTRQIVASEAEGANATDAVCLAVHFPFAREPQQGDRFFLWNHAYACTSPLRLFAGFNEDFDTNVSTEDNSFLFQDPIINQSMYGDYVHHSSGTNTSTRRFSISSGVATSKSYNSVLTTNHGLYVGDVVQVTETTDSAVAAEDALLTVATVTAPDTLTFTGVSGNATIDVINSNREAGVNFIASSNPINSPFNLPTFKALFGGLDLRDSFSGVVTEIADADTNANLKITSANHKRQLGEVVSLEHGITADDDQEANYEINEIVDANNFKVVNSDTGASTATGINWNTNKWELFSFDQSGDSKVGLLKAGINQWDKGVTQGNLIRRDRDTASNSDIYLFFGEPAIKITTSAADNQDGDFFQPNVEYDYKISFTYDGIQEGPLSDSSWLGTPMIGISATKQYMDIYILIDKWSDRLTHVNLYRKDGQNSFYRIVESISTASGWIEREGAYIYTHRDKGPVGSSYEARTGINETITKLNMKYAISTEIDNMLFIGNCNHENISNSENQIFRSKAGKYSIFDWSSDYAVLKSRPTAMVNFAGKLFAFDENRIYRINPHTLVVEDEYEGVGCLSQDSITVTEEAMFFADKNGAFVHNGQIPKKISVSIESGGDSTLFVSSGTTNVSNNVKDLDWISLVRNNKHYVPKVIFDSSRNTVLFIISIDITDNETTVKEDYIWAFNTTKGRWDLWLLSKADNIGKPFLGKNGGLYIPINKAIYEFRASGKKRDYTWISKKLSMGQESIDKVYTRVKVNGNKEDLVLGGSGAYSSDKLIIKTSSGLITDSTYNIKGTEDSEYKLKGANRKGRWLQFKLEDMKDSVDSFGIIFRKKTTK